MSDLGNQKLTISQFTLTRKVNLGNYETCDISLTFETAGIPNVVKTHVEQALNLINVLVDVAVLKRNILHSESALISKEYRTKVAFLLLVCDALENFQPLPTKKVTNELTYTNE